MTERDGFNEAVSDLMTHGQNVTKLNAAKSILKTVWIQNENDKKELTDIIKRLGILSDGEGERKVVACMFVKQSFTDETNERTRYKREFGWTRRRQ